MNLGIPLGEEDRRRLDQVCGPGRRVKRGAWVADAIRAALDREEADKAAAGEARR